MSAQPNQEQSSQQQKSINSAAPQDSNLVDKVSGKFVDQSAPAEVSPDAGASEVGSPGGQEVPQPPWISDGSVSSPPPPGAVPPPETSGAAVPPPEPSIGEVVAGGAPIEESPFKKIFLFLIIGAVIIGALFLVFRVILPKFKEGKSGSKEEITLTYWGLWEPEEVFAPVIGEYNKNNPNVKINYIRQSPKDYRERLQSALAKGDGPDIFRFHNTWLPMLKNNLSPASNETAASLNLSGSYFPIIAKDLKIDTATYGAPLYFDSLALFYNTKIFQEAGETPPSSWEELRKTALALTVKDNQGKIQISGAALGTTGNVDHFSDILGLMMLQNGADLSRPNDTYAADALTFYTLFVTQDHVWDSTLPSSVYAFATGKAAMIFASSWRVFEIQEINPNLDFKVVPVPQLPGTQISWATYWAEGVSKKSKNTQAAWDFLQYLSSKEALTKLYTAESGLRSFGEPYPRLDLASQLESDPLAAAFVKQGPFAQSWYLCSQTYDNGINDKMIKYYEDAVNAVVAKKATSEKALETTAQGVNQVLIQYGLSSEQ